MADPLADLRIPLTPMAPRAQFAADLRRRLDAEIHGTHPDPQGEPTVPVATEIIASLVVHDAAAALRFYEQGLGATVTYRYDDGDKVGHAEVTIGTVKFNVADPYPDQGFVPPDRPATSQSFTLRLTVSDPDAAFARAIAAGATVERPVEDQFYGARTGSFRDPFGFYWSVTKPIEGVEPPPSSADPAPSS